MGNTLANAAYDQDDINISSQLTEMVPEQWANRERRLNIRAYDYWESLLDGRPFPSVTDLDPNELEVFKQRSLLLDFTKGYEEPVLRYIGAWLRDESGITDNSAHPDTVPRGTILSRLTDHYLEILANRAPVGFEAEFTHKKGTHILYRGILLPLSDDGENINFIYGVVSWKEEEYSEAIRKSEAALMADLSQNSGEKIEALLKGDGPNNDVPALSGTDMVVSRNGGNEELLQPLGGDVEDVLTDLEQGDTLPDILAKGQDAAHQFTALEGRSRAALYRALSLCHAFAVVSVKREDEYLAILADAQIKRQKRAPFTPVIKLIFGVGFDKTRITEYATVLAHAARLDVPFDGFEGFLANFEGGLKAVVKAERELRRGPVQKKRATRSKKSRAMMREAPSVARVHLKGQDLPDDEFLLLLGRRDGESVDIDLLDVVEQKPELLDQLINRAAKKRQTAKKRSPS